MSDETTKIDFVCPRCGIEEETVLDRLFAGQLVTCEECEAEWAVYLVEIEMGDEVVSERV